MAAKTLSVGIGLWAALPDFETTAAAISHEGNAIVCGSREGLVALWNVSDWASLKLSPRAIVTGHRSAITAIGFCVFQNDPSFICGHEDGSLRVFSLQDGHQATYSLRALPFAPTVINSRTCKRRRLVFCAGNSNEIHVIELPGLQLVCRLQWHCAFVVDMTVYPASQDSQTCPLHLVSVDSDGQVALWTLAIDRRTMPTDRFLPTAFRETAATKHACLCLSPDRGLLLCVTSTQFSLFDVSSNFAALLEVCCSEDDAFVGGVFLNQKRYLLWTMNAKLLLFDSPPQDNRAKRIATVSELCVLSASLQKPEWPSEFFAPSRLYSLAGDRLFHFSNSAELVAWKIGDALVSSDTACPPCVSADLSDGFLSFGDHGDRICDPMDSPATATAVLQLPDLDDPVLWAVGHENGKITLHSLPACTQENSLVGHTDAITCLEQCTSLPDCLISGSLDGSVRVWSVCSCSLMHAFHLHCSPVRALLQPPEEKQLLCPVVCSVAADATVCLFYVECWDVYHVLGGHEAVVVGVRWSLEQDVVLVLCENGVVYVWQVSNGELERVVTDRELAALMFGGPMGPALDVSDWDVSAVPQEVSCVPGCVYSPAVVYMSTACGYLVVARMDFEHGPSFHSLLINVPELLLVTRSTLLAASERQQASDGHSRFASDAIAMSPTPLLGGSNATGVFTPSTSPLANPVSLSPSTSLEATAVVPWKYAPSSFSYTVGTYFLAMGYKSDAASDAPIREELGWGIPMANTSFCVPGAGKGISALLPCVVRGVGRWQVSPSVSAMWALSSAAFFKTVMGTVSDLHVIASQQMALVCAVLPASVDYYHAPCLLMLSRHWASPEEDLQQAAKTLVKATLERFSAEERQQVARYWASHLRNFQALETAVDFHSSQGMAALVLCLIAAHFGDAVESSMLAHLAATLVRVLNARAVGGSGSGVHVNLAAQLLAKGFSCWLPHIRDLNGLIRRLFALTVTGTQHNDADWALRVIGSEIPAVFVRVMTEEATSDQSQIKRPDAALATLVSVVKKCPVLMLPHLPVIIEAIIRTLDPSHPALRTSCLQSSSLCLRELVRKFPMTSFHHETQRLAVGTGDYVIVIYDLRTATKWKILEGHTAAITALTFDESGTHLASYAASEGALRSWKVGSSGLFDMVGLMGRCTKVLPVPNHLKGVGDIQQAAATMQFRLQFTSSTSLMLLRGKTTVCLFRL